VEWGLKRTNPEKLLQQRKALARFLKNCETVEINHPLAGQTIVDPSLTSLRVRLFTLRTEGFYVPDGAIRAVDVEIARRAIN
jgi:hypothetical protein